MSLLCRRSSVALFCLFFVALSSVRAFAASRYTMVPLKEIAPKEEVSKEVAATLEPVAMRILDRKKKPFADIWLRRRLEPQKAKNEPGSRTVTFRLGVSSA